MRATDTRGQFTFVSGPWLHLAFFAAFNDPDLNALEEELNIDNLNIKERFQPFMEARTLIAQAHSQYWPIVGADPAWTRQKSSSSLTNSTRANAGRTSTRISFPVEVSWVPDFWGKISNQVREYQYAAQVSAADLETASQKASASDYREQR